MLTSHDELGNTGLKTGFWTEELAAPYYALSDKGVEITLVSPKGGQPPIDPKSEDPSSQTDATRRMDNDEVLKNKLKTPINYRRLKVKILMRYFILVDTVLCGIWLKIRFHKTL